MSRPSIFAPRQDPSSPPGWRMRGMTAGLAVAAAVAAATAMASGTARRGARNGLRGVEKMGRKAWLASLLALAVSTPAGATFIAPDTPFTVNSTNATITGSSNVTFTPGVAQTISSGNVLLTIQTIPEAGGQEWLLYSFTSVTPSLAGNINADWELQIQGLVTTQPVSVNHFFVGWGQSQQLYNPTSDTGVNLPIETNPITGVGQVFGEPITGVVESVLDGSGTANTFAALIENNYTQDPNTTDFFEIGELIGPSAVPEPASGLILVIGVLGLMWARKRYLTPR